MKKLLEKMKSIILNFKFKDLVEKIKKFFSKKSNIVSFVVVVSIIVILFIVILLTKNKDDKFALNPMYDVYPEQVRELYANMVEVSCYGDLYFDIELDKGEINVSDISKNNLIDYMLSHLDKDDKLVKEFKPIILKNTAKRLFYGEIDLLGQFNSYGYGGYAYTIDGDLVTRKEQECVADKKYITHLYGYSESDDRLKLSIDVNIGYLIDDILYDLNDKKLGKYDGDMKKLRDLFNTSPYYRLNYVNNEDALKLYSVELNSKG